MICLCIITGFISCNDDDKGPVPTSIDAKTLTYKKAPGAVVIKWTIPENPTYKYIKVTYQVPGEASVRTRLASMYSDSIKIDNLLARYGEIEYSLQPHNAQGTGGEIVKITAQAGAATKTIYETYKDLLTFDINHVWSDNPETSEGPLSALIDGNENNFFHMSWSNSKPFPHYIVFDLGQERTALRFRYVCRDNNNKDNPKEIDVLVSNTFENTADYYTNETGTTLLKSFSGLPRDKKAVYETTQTIKSEKPFRYVWFKIKSSTSGKNWVALAEWQIFKIREKLYDPEINETTVVEY